MHIDTKLPAIIDRPTFELAMQQEWAHPIVISIPHGGESFPCGFLAASPLTHDALLATMDVGTSGLMDCTPCVPVIRAKYARSFVDLNRPRDMLDPAMVEDVPACFDSICLAGYGVIPRFASRGKMTSSGKITKAEAEARLRQFYDPYHNELAAMLGKGIARFGHVTLIDLHSAPANCMNGFDVVLGTGNGAAMDIKTANLVADCFRDQGFTVAIDAPFSGGHITMNYGAVPKVRALQIEFNRALLADGSFDLAKSWKKIAQDIWRLPRLREAPQP